MKPRTNTQTSSNLTHSKHISTIIAIATPIVTTPVPVIREKAPPASNEMVLRRPASPFDGRGAGDPQIGKCSHSCKTVQCILKKLYKKASYFKAKGNTTSIATHMPPSRRRPNACLSVRYNSDQHAGSPNNTTTDTR
ncbi:hypothetical protein FOQG_16884 [Fusarium oxysporum f. sp. raphani 54005]|uniref:Uncharacterized protein n=1 Tax=Fusarium oxysporum f. sp. raphani 54005 TaxID=1089458 RepID=X0C6T5_FUSOX|nr:hypothetical protein FOQG_16884 [Fusarium oxysporum f. sp. raphani 54005]